VQKSLIECITQRVQSHFPTVICTIATSLPSSQNEGGSDDAFAKTTASDAIRAVLDEPVYPVSISFAVGVAPAVTQATTATVSDSKDCTSTCSASSFALADASHLPSSQELAEASDFQEPRQLDVWVGDDDQVLLVEDSASCNDTGHTWIGADEGAILLDENSYIDTSGMLNEDIDAWVAEAFSVASEDVVPSANFPHNQEELSALRLAIINKLRLFIPDFEAFLNQPIIESAHFIRHDFEEFRQKEHTLSGLLHTFSCRRTIYCTESNLCQPQLPGWLEA
jgi:hypothetical protein